MIDKVTQKKGEALFSTQLEKQNIENFEELLPYFYLNAKTENRVINSLDPALRTEKDNSFDIFLGLNSQRRRWFKISEIEQSSDRSYRIYYGKLLYYRDYGNYTHSPLFCKEKIQKYDLLNYDIYKSGKIKYKNQEYKLFKFLLKIELLDQDEVNLITSYKPPNKITYFCISRNPIDYLFCATHQSFKSCEALTSPNSGAFYMGLGALSLDPNRCIIFTTDGDIGNYTIKGLNFNHPYYSCRSWGIWLENNQVYIVRYYPHELFPFDTLLNEIGIKSLISLPNDIITSKHKFILPRFQDDSESFIFLDHLGLSKSKYGYYYDSYNGLTGCLSENFNWRSGFEGISDWEDLIEKAEYCCRCEVSIPPDDAYYNAAEEIYCYTCYVDVYASCDNCEDEIYRDDMFVVDNGDKILCSDCYAQNVTHCKDCDEACSTKLMYWIGDEEYFVCNDCLSDYMYCENCNTHYKDLCIKCSPHCPKCDTIYKYTCNCQLKLDGV